MSNTNDLINNNLKYFMENIARPWMLAYSIIFGLLSVKFVHDDIEDQYNIIYIIEGAICFGLIFAGNLIYSLDFNNPNIRKIWKFIFPIIILDFIISGIIDSFYGTYARNANIGLSVDVVLRGITWIVYFALYFPTFWAHYKIGYGKVDNDPM